MTQVQKDSEAVKISIPRTAEESYDGDYFTVYCIHVTRTTPHNQTWVVNRRYNEFYDLHETLKKRYKEDIVQKYAFPPKSFFSPSVEKIEGRRKSFEDYIIGLIALPVFPSELIFFLRVTNLNCDSDEMKDSATASRGNQAPDPTSPKQIRSDDTGHNVEPASVSVRTASFLWSRSGEQSTVSEQKLESVQPVIEPVQFVSAAEMFKKAMMVTVVLTTIPSVLYILGKFLLFWSIDWDLKVDTLNSIVFGIGIRLHEWRVGFKALLAFCVLAAYFHRILGFAVGAYLTDLLGTPRGAFNFRFGWIALRLGLDENELVISNFVWANPPRFKPKKDSPDFIKVDKLLLRFRLSSVWEAISEKGKSIKIHYMEINTLKVYMVKGSHEDGLNLWAALGADCVEQETQVQSSVTTSLLKAMQATASASSNFINAVAHYNPASVLYRFARRGSTAAGDEKTSSKDADGGDSPKQSKAKVKGHGQERDDHAGDEDDDDDDDDHDFEDGRESVVGRESMVGAHESSHHKSLDGASPKGHDSSKKDVKANPVNNHWNVPFTFEVDVFTVRDLFLFAQDFLNAEHSDGATSDSRAIKVKLMEMRRKELTDRPLKKGQYRRGVYLDDLTWRVVGRLINELFSSNKIAMGTILMNAAGNNASAAVIGTAVSVVSGVAGAASSTAKFAAGTAASTVKGVTEEFHTYNAKTALLGATALGTKVVHSVSHTFHKGREEIKSAYVLKENIHSLRVRLLSARNLKLAGKPVSTCLCKLRLRNQAGENEQAKSTAKKTNSEGLAVWGEVFELSPVLTMKAELYLRLFESHMMTADSFVGELSLALDVGANLQEKEEEAEELQKRSVSVSVAVAADPAGVARTSLGGGNGGSGASGPPAIARSLSHTGGGSRTPLAIGKTVWPTDQGGDVASARIGLREERVEWHRILGRDAGSGGEVLLGLTLC